MKTVLPEGFEYLDEAVPGLKWQAMYAGSENFMGRPADGYFANRTVAAREAAEALKCAAVKTDYSLFVFDAYRPARAVADFCRWAEAPGDEIRKAIHFPNVEKTKLIELGYIAARSGHSRGSTIDLTLCGKDGMPLDMGTVFDFMDPRSHHGCPDLTKEQTRNRETLRTLMLSCGFTDYSEEWWHYRLKNEPYPDTYFDFVIE